MAKPLLNSSRSSLFDLASMDIPMYIRQCVAFLAYNGKDGMQTVGTVFFVAKLLPGTAPEEGLRQEYAITARHLIEKAKEKSIDGKIYIRITHLETGSEFFECPVAAWTVHPTRNIDAAIMPIITGADYKEGSMLAELILTQEIIDKNEIGPGDDLFFPGLFVHHMGERDNIPIVRTGTIAAMPGEPIHTITQGYMRAYLIEARSIGGLSGSPVFLHLSGPRAAQAGAQAWNTFFLLGMIQGHYGVRDVLDLAEEDVLIDGRTRSINYGIAIVVPIDDIISIVDLPQFVAERESKLARRRSKSS